MISLNIVLVRAAAGNPVHSVPCQTFNTIVKPKLFIGVLDVVEKEKIIKLAHLNNRTGAVSWAIRVGVRRIARTWSGCVKSSVSHTSPGTGIGSGSRDSCSVGTVGSSGPSTKSLSWWCDSNSRSTLTSESESLSTSSAEGGTSKAGVSRSDISSGRDEASAGESKESDKCGCRRQRGAARLFGSGIAIENATRVIRRGEVMLHGSAPEAA